jgi:uncharacterized membrane protein YraQ (UPF0718 family)
MSIQTKLCCQRRVGFERLAGQLDVVMVKQNLGREILFRQGQFVAVQVAKLVSGIFPRCLAAQMDASIEIIRM